MSRTAAFHESAWLLPCYRRRLQNQRIFESSGLAARYNHVHIQNSTPKIRVECEPGLLSQCRDSSKHNSVGESSRSLGLKRAGVVNWKRGCAGHFGNLKCQSRKHGRGHLHLQSHSLRPIEGLYGVSTSLPFSTSFEVWTVCVWSSFPLEIHQPPEHTSSSN